MQARRRWNAKKRRKREEKEIKNKFLMHLTVRSNKNKNGRKGESHES